MPKPRSDAVRMVLERNPEVEAARNAWEGARARARLDRALPDPEFEFEELPRVGLHDHGDHTIGVSQQVEFPLKWWHRLRAGRQQAEAARLALFEMAGIEMEMRAKRAYDRIALNSCRSAMPARISTLPGHVHGRRETFRIADFSMVTGVLSTVGFMLGGLSSILC